MRHRFWAATRKAVLRTRGRGGAGKPLKRRAPPRAPAEPRTPSRPQAPRLPQAEDADTDPGCPGHPGFPAPVGALLPAPPRYSSWERNAGLLTCLLGTNRGGGGKLDRQGPGPQARPLPALSWPEASLHRSAEPAVTRPRALCGDGSHQALGVTTTQMQAH